MDGIDAVWDTIVRDVKANVWGPPKPQEPDAFYSSKFSNGEVRWDWSNAKWLESRWAGIPKSSTRNCRTATAMGRR